MEMIAPLCEVASYSTTFRMMLEAQLPSALLNRVSKIGMEKTSTTRYVNKKYILFNNFVVSDLSWSILLYKSGHIRVLLVTCNPVLPVSWSGCRRLNRLPHQACLMRRVARHPAELKTKPVKGRMSTSVSMTI